MLIEIQSSEREQVIDITEEINKLLKREKVEKGICVIFLPHTTAALIANESYDENLSKDILNCLRQQVGKGKWLHDAIDNNADSHIKASLLGNSLVVPIQHSKLLLGQWQGIMLVELDGPRKRKVIVEVIKNR